MRRDRNDLGEVMPRRHQAQRVQKFLLGMHLVDLVEHRDDRRMGLFQALQYVIVLGRPAGRVA